MLNGVVYFARHPETQLAEIGFGQPPPDLRLEETTPGTRNAGALARGYLTDWERFLARWRAG